MTTLAYDVIARDRASRTFTDVGRSVDRMNDQVDKSNKGFGLLGGAARAGALGVAAAGAAVFGASRMLSGFIGEARESQRVTNLTAQVIKTTGGAAKVTAQQVSDLATAISNKTGRDDELVQTSANLLLTFKNVRNEVGKSNDIFNQATQAAIDLSAAGFGDVEGASKMLGKALNDPIKGITALGRAGVTFTQAQKDQIRAMVEAGNTLGAQRIIMGEVQSQVGGAAAATATATDKMRVTFGNLKEQVGTALLPVVDRFATFMTSRAAPAVSGFFNGLSGNTKRMAQEDRPRLELFGMGLRAMTQAFRDGDRTSNGFIGGMERVGVVLRNVAGFVRTQVLPRLAEFNTWVRVRVVPALVQMYRNAMPGVLSALRSTQKALQDNKPELLALWSGFKRVSDFVVRYIVPVIGTLLRAKFTEMGHTIRITINTIGFLVRAAQTMHRVIVSVLSFVTRAFLSWAGNTLRAATLAFGWMPGIGPKLKAANKEFEKFAAGVNRSLNSINPGPTITVRAQGYGRVTTAGGRVTNVPLAKGGPVPHVPGSRPDRDSVPALLQPDEFVVRKDGSNLRDALRYFGAPGYAAGGVVASTARITNRWADAMEGSITGLFTRLAQRLYDRIAPALGAGRTGAYGGVKPHVAAVGDLVARRFGISSILGVGSRGNVSDHPLGLALDFMTGRNTSLGNQVAQFLTGGWNPYKVKYLIWNALYSGSAGSWSRYTHPAGRTDPTAMHRDHVHASFRSYDKGGFLPPGLSLAYNGTGRPERVSPADERPIVIQLILDGQVIEQALVGRKGRKGRLAFQL